MVGAPRGSDGDGDGAKASMVGGAAVSVTIVVVDSRSRLDRVPSESRSVRNVTLRAAFIAEKCAVLPPAAAVPLAALPF